MSKISKSDLPAVHSGLLEIQENVSYYLAEAESQDLPPAFWRSALFNLGEQVERFQDIGSLISEDPRATSISDHLWDDTLNPKVTQRLFTPVLDLNYLTLTQDIVFTQLRTGIKAPDWPMRSRQWLQDTAPVVFALSAYGTVGQVEAKAAEQMINTIQKEIYSFAKSLDVTPPKHGLNALLKVQKFGDMFNQIVQFDIASYGDRNLLRNRRRQVWSAGEGAGFKDYTLLDAERFRILGNPVKRFGYLIGIYTPDPLSAYGYVELPNKEDITYVMPPLEKIVDPEGPGNVGAQVTSFEGMANFAQGYISSDEGHNTQLEGYIQLAINRVLSDQPVDDFITALNFLPQARYQASVIQRLENLGNSNDYGKTPQYTTFVNKVSEQVKSNLST